MPGRAEFYNQLARIGGENILSSELLARIQANKNRHSFRTDLWQLKLHRWWIACLPMIGGLLWPVTDLPKVVGTAALSGIRVGFPLLDDALVEFSMTLPANQKVRRLTLRHFFKESLQGFLPDEIIRKKKHGFGLPVGPWLVQDPKLNKLADRALSHLIERRLVRPELARGLVSARLTEHAGYYGEIIWVLMMLEYWLASHAPDFVLTHK